MSDRSDPELVEAIRNGTQEAFDELFQRHYDAALQYASRFAPPDVAPLRAAQGFARVLRALRLGEAAEPDVESFVHAAVRSAHADVVRQGRREVWLEQHEEYSPAEDGVPVRRAFARLRPTSRRVLWHTVVLDESDEEVAAQLGVTSKAVAGLAVRARREFRQACREEELAPPVDLAEVLTPALLLEFPRLVADPGRRRWPVTLPRTAPVVAAAVAAVVLVVVVVVLALTVGSDDGPPATAAPDAPGGTTEPGTSGAAVPPALSPSEGSESAKPSKSATSESPSASVTPTETPTVPSSSEPLPPPVTDPTDEAPAPSPAVSHTGGGVTGGLVPTGRAEFAITPNGADRVTVQVSNASFVSVTGAGVRCAAPDGGTQKVVTCTVVGSGPFGLTVRGVLAAPSDPFTGSVTVAGASGSATAGFSMAAG
jgi:DNA-directed RNA polymerase specialized sigma24 family protein